MSRESFISKVRAGLINPNTTPICLPAALEIAGPTLPVEAYNHYASLVIDQRRRSLSPPAEANEFRQALDYLEQKSGARLTLTQITQARQIEELALRGQPFVGVQIYYQQKFPHTFAATNPEVKYLDDGRPYFYTYNFTDPVWIARDQPDEPSYLVQDTEMILLHLQSLGPHPNTILFR